jgi:hypothetical protein
MFANKYGNMGKMRVGKKMKIQQQDRDKYAAVL